MLQKFFLDTEYDFYIYSAVSGVSSPVQKLIKLIITNCSAKNWKKCINTSTLTCDTCVSGYVLISGVWDISKTTTSQSSQTATSQSSQTTSGTAEALNKTTTLVVIAIAGIAVLTSTMNTASITNLWMTINQLQLFFILAI